jgi:hypothetical protein
MRLNSLVESGGNAMSGNASFNGIDIDDASIIRIKVIFRKEYFTEKVPTSDIYEAISLLSKEAEFHPIKRLFVFVEMGRHQTHRLVLY